MPRHHWPMVKTHVVSITLKSFWIKLLAITWFHGRVPNVKNIIFIFGIVASADVEVVNSVSWYPLRSIIVHCDFLPLSIWQLCRLNWFLSWTVNCCLKNKANTNSFFSICLSSPGNHSLDLRNCFVLTRPWWPSSCYARLLELLFCCFEVPAHPHMTTHLLHSCKVAMLLLNSCATLIVEENVVAYGA